MPLDIVIFGVIAVVLIFRFLGVLGRDDKNDGRPRRDAFGNYKKALEKQRAQRESARSAAEEKKKKTSQPASVRSPQPTLVRPQPTSVSEMDSATDKDSLSLNDKAFLEGAKAAFAMILDAYATGDQRNLESLLERELFLRMNSDIEKRQKAEQRLAISLYEIVEANIEKRSQDERYEQVAVAFTSKQCHLLFDKDNKLIDGDPDEEELLHDLWTFRQERASEDPTWYLCATRSQSAPPKKKATRSHAHKSPKTAKTAATRKSLPPKK